MESKGRITPDMLSERVHGKDLRTSSQKIDEFGYFKMSLKLK